MTAAYIQVHFRLDFIVEAKTMNPDQQSDPYCLQRLPKNISRQGANLSSCKKRANGQTYHGYTVEFYLRKIQ